MVFAKESRWSQPGGEENYVYTHCIGKAYTMGLLSKDLKEIGTFLEVCKYRGPEAGVCATLLGRSEQGGHGRSWTLSGEGRSVKRTASGRSSIFESDAVRLLQSFDGEQKVFCIFRACSNHLCYWWPHLNMQTLSWL
jgi:hypothetical protein